MKLQLTVEKLKQIINEVEQNYKRDDSLSKTVVITLIKEADTHLESDKVEVEQKSGYAECFSKNICYEK